MVVLYSTFHFSLRTWSANRCTRRRTCVAHALLFLSVSLSVCLSVSQSDALMQYSTRTVLCSPNADVLIDRRLASGDEHVDLSKSTGAHMIDWSFASFRSHCCSTLKFTCTARRCRPPTRVRRATRRHFASDWRSRRRRTRTWRCPSSRSRPRVRPFRPRRRIYSRTAGRCPSLRA